MAFDIQPPKKSRKSAPAPVAKQESVVVKKKPALKKAKKITPPKLVKKKSVEPRQVKKIPKKKTKKQTPSQDNSFLRKMFFVGIGIFIVVVVLVLRKDITQLSKDKDTKSEVKSGIVQTFSNPNPVDITPSQLQSDKPAQETPESVLLKAHNNFVKNLSAVIDKDVVVPEMVYDMTDEFSKYLEEF